MSQKVCQIFPFPLVLQRLSHFTFTIFGTGPHILLTNSHLCFLTKIVYYLKVGISISLTFRITLITFLKTRTRSIYDKFYMVKGMKHLIYLTLLLCLFSFLFVTVLLFYYIQYNFKICVQ